MPSYVTPKINTAFEFYVGLVSQANGKIFQVSPTLAAGDVKVSTDNGTSGNITTLPVIGTNTRLVKVNLSAAEMNGANVSVTFSDAAGAEWCDLVVNIQTSARQIDDLAYPATSGRSMVVDASGLVDANAVKVGPSGSGTAQTAGDIMADTNDIQTRLPAALVGGRMDASVGTIAAAAITAASIAADAITDAKVASDVTIASVTGAVGSVTGAVGSVTGAVGSVTGAVGSVTGNVGGNVTGSVGSVTGNVGGNVTGSVGSIATGGIAAASFSAGAIDAAAIATDAIGSDELAASAVTEIQSGLSTLTAAGVRTAVGLATANLDTQLDALPTNAELATALAAADDATLAAIAALSIPTVSAIAAAILAAATTTPIASDVKKINATTVTGDGSATPWGPL